MRSSRTIASRSASLISRSGQASYRSKTTTTTLTLSTKRISNTGYLFIGGRSIWTASGSHNLKRSLPWLTGIIVGFASTATYFYASNAPVNYDDVKKDIKKILESNPKYDDGSYAPLLIRLAWHAAGTYSIHDKTGGSNGATMRYSPESDWGANRGLKLARELLEPIKAKYPGITYADLWTLAGCVAVEAMGGPRIPWYPGREDYKDNSKTVPDGRLPDASQGRDHIRDIFYRMGFSDKEIVALLGAHSVGRCHTDRSGYDGPWTSSPTRFSNEFYIQLLENKWIERKWNGPKQFKDESSGELMMLPTDLELAADPKFKPFVELYANDEKAFFNDFAAAFGKLLALGVPPPKNASSGSSSSPGISNLWGLIGDKK